MSKIEYDKTEIYQSEVKPLLQQVLALCASHSLPIALMVAFAARDGEDGDIIHRSAVLAGGKDSMMPTGMEILTKLMGDGALFDQGMALAAGALGDEVSI